MRRRSGDRGISSSGTPLPVDLIRESESPSRHYLSARLCTSSRVYSLVISPFPPTSFFLLNTKPEQPPTSPSRSAGPTMRRMKLILPHESARIDASRWLPFSLISPITRVISSAGVLHQGWFCRDVSEHIVVGVESGYASGVWGFLLC
jgi:hypothetical protein